MEQTGPNPAGGSLSDPNGGAASVGGANHGGADSNAAKPGAASVGGANFGAASVGGLNPPPPPPDRSGQPGLPDQPIVPGRPSLPGQPRVLGQPSYPIQPPVPGQPGPAASDPKAGGKGGRKQRGAWSWKRFWLLCLCVVLLAGAACGGGVVLGWKLADEAGRAAAPAPDPSVVTVAAGEYLSAPVVHMPDVRGLDENAAMEVLADSGVSLDIVVTSTKPWAGEAGSVIEQSPAFGSADPKVVNLVLSEAAKVPAITGRTASEVATELSALGSEIVYVNLYDPDAPAGQALKIEPAAGAALPEQVTITVAEPSSSVYLATMESLNDSCRNREVALNATTYQQALVCEVRPTEPFEMSFVLSRVVDTVSGTIGIPDTAEPGDKAKVTLLADGVVVAEGETEYGVAPELVAKTSGALRLTVRIENLVPAPSDAEGSVSSGRTIEVGLGDFLTTGGIEAMTGLQGDGS